MGFKEGIDTVNIENVSNETSIGERLVERNRGEASEGIRDDEVKDYSQEGVQHPDFVRVFFSESGSQSHKSAIQSDASGKEDQGKNLPKTTAVVESLKHIEEDSDEPTDDCDDQEESDISGDVAGDGIDEKDVGEIVEDSEELGEFWGIQSNQTDWVSEADHGLAFEIVGDFDRSGSID